MQGQLTQGPSTIRKDIQGLRALAVLSVVVFHVSPERLTGGFIGVDIFFVISGYLIIGQIWKNLGNSQFSFRDFYSKRFKRLFPALFLVTLCTAVTAYFTLLPSDYKDFTYSHFTTLAYFSNFWFYTQSGYFDDSLQSAPLLHTWSLSVEEQFYFIAPLLLFFLFKYSKNKAITLSIIISVAVVTFTLSEWLIHIDQPLSFFSSFTRFWQFLAGGFVAIYLKNPPNKIISNILTLLGLLILLVTIFTYNEETLFPGFLALPVTIATALIIYSRTSSSLIFFTLSNPVSQFFGNISYSLYLWHWPVIVFYKNYALQNLLLDDFDKFDKLIIILVSVILATFTYHFVENPARKLKIEKKAIKPIIISIATSLTLASMVKVSATTQKSLYTKEQLHYESYLGYTDPLSRANDCFLTSKRNSFSYFDKEKCISQAENKLNILLIGDSHAKHWYTALTKTLEKNQTLSQATASGCKPGLPIKGERRCTDMLKWVLTDLLPHQSFDRIIISARWIAGDDTRLAELLQELAKYNTELIVLGPVVEYKHALPRLLSRFQDSSKIMKFANYDIKKRVDTRMKDSAQKHGATYYSVIDVLCPTKHMCQHTTQDRIPIQFDYGHLTGDGALLLLNQLNL